MENNDLAFLDATEELAIHNMVRMPESQFKTYLPMFVPDMVSQEKREKLYTDYFKYSNVNSPVAVMRGNKVLFIAPPLGTRLNVNMEGMEVAQKRAAEFARKGYTIDVTQALYQFVNDHSTDIVIDNAREQTWAGILDAYGIESNFKTTTKASTTDDDQDGIEWDFD